MSRHGRDEEETVEGLRAQLDQVTAELVAALAQLDRISAASALPVAADGTGPLPATRVQGHRAAGRRVPKDQWWLRAVPGVVPAALGGIWAALRHSARHSWAAHHAALTAATATVPVVALAATVTLSAPAVKTLPWYSSTASAPAAVAATAPAPATVVIHRKRRRERKPAPVSVPPPATVSRPSPSPSLSSLPPSPQISVPAALDTGVYMAGQIVIGNPQDQAVPWSVSCGQDASITPSQGVLEPGQQGVQLQVQVDPVDGAAGVLCTFWPGGERLVITWAGAGSPSEAAG